MTTAGLLSPDRSPTPSATTFGHQPTPNHASTSSENGHPPAVTVNGHAAAVAHDHVGKSALRTPRTTKATTVAEPEETAWGSNFWVTLVDPQVFSSRLSKDLALSLTLPITRPQTQTSFFACPATGQVSWDPPVGNFVYVLFLRLLRRRD
jgi:hypothetical protein